MGCISSKHAAAVADSPPYDKDHAYGFLSSKNHSGGGDPKRHNDDNLMRKKIKKLDNNAQNARSGLSIKSGLSYRNVEAEQIAAGWPAWLTTSAAEAIQGWLPLRADAYEKLEKIGQGTYSSVFRAREVESGRLVALKKVRFDNYQPESIRFMAREIMILRRLDHPNIMSLDGIITSRLSNSIYLVFEYMEHDLAGLSSSPDIRFTESQVKCYMKQLLHGLEHCHLRGIIHRDIKASNILVNNKGILKIGDFGLANIITQRNKNQLTSRVVTLWYRAPELLMGSTSYGVSVDIWSAGCVFAEILLSKPILKGRTEIEQLHKIYKLCGSPQEEFWRNPKLPQATMFKPQHPYESTLRERCKEFPTSAVNLLETLLSFEPENRGTASSSLNADFFHMKPYPCEPSALPKYPPNKEMDAKHREELRRRKAGMKMHPAPAKKSKKPRKVVPDQKMLSRMAPKEMQEREQNQLAQRNYENAQTHHGRESLSHRGPQNLSYDTVSESSQSTTTDGSYLYSGASAISQATAPSGIAWGKRRKDLDNISTLTYNHPSSMSQVSASSVMFMKNGVGMTIKESESEESEHESGAPDSTEMDENEEGHYNDVYLSQECKADGNESMVNHVNHNHTHRKSHAVSGPLIPHAHRVEQLLQRNESHIRRAARRAQYDRGEH